MITLISTILLAMAMTDVQSVEQNDSRFQAVQPTEPGFKPQVLVDSSEPVHYWQYRIGSDDTPALLIAVEDEKRVWVDAKRDGSWVELSRVVAQAASLGNDVAQAASLGANKRTDILQWSGTIRTQAPASRSAVWPTPESIDIRLSREPTTGLWRLASLAQLDGQLTIDGKALAYRLRDENSDGKFEGVEDSLTVDLNGNGQFERLREQVPLTKFFRVNGKRYAIQLDRERKTVGAQSIDATGTAQLNFEGWESLVQAPTELHVVLQSSSGIQVVFDSREPQVVPVGDYHIYAATLNWEGEEKWRMTFSRWDSLPKKTYRINANENTPITVLGKAEVTAEIEGLSYSNNQWQVTIQPLLKTESGLYLTRASSGRLQASVDGMLIAHVQSGTDRILTSGSTQFACGTFCPINMTWKNETAAHVELSFNSGPLAGVMTNKIKVESK